ncbi:MAG: hypothetical protein PHX51_00505 [Clostridia bacterium]|nr:hypothetical protein [Clostridia bacterium]
MSGFFGGRARSAAIALILICVAAVFVATVCLDRVAYADYGVRENGVYFVDAKSICVDEDHHVYIADDLHNGSSLIYLFHGGKSGDLFEQPISIPGSVSEVRYAANKLYVLADGAIASYSISFEGDDYSITSQTEFSLTNILGFDVDEGRIVAVVDGEGGLHDNLYVLDVSGGGSWLKVDLLGDSFCDVMISDGDIYVLYNKNQLKIFDYDGEYRSLYSITFSELANPLCLAEINGKPFIAGEDLLYEIVCGANVSIKKMSVTPADGDSSYCIADIAYESESSVYIMNLSDGVIHVDIYLLNENRLQCIGDYAGDYEILSDELTAIYDTPRDFVFAYALSYPSNLVYSLCKGAVSDEWLKGSGLSLSDVSHLPQRLNPDTQLLVLNYFDTLDDFLLVFFDGKFGWIRRDADSLRIVRPTESISAKQSAHYSVTVYEYPSVKDNVYVYEHLDTSEIVMSFTTIFGFNGFGAASGWDYVQYKNSAGFTKYGFVLSGELDLKKSNPPTYTLARANPPFGQRLIVYGGNGGEAAMDIVTRVDSGTTLRVFESYETMSYIGVYVDNQMYYGYVYSSRICYEGMTTNEVVVMLVAVITVIILLVCAVLIAKIIKKAKTDRKKSKDNRSFAVSADINASGNKSRVKTKRSKDVAPFFEEEKRPAPAKKSDATEVVSKSRKKTSKSSDVKSSDR